MAIFVAGYLTLDVIQLCNLNCDMCLRGENTGKRISREVVEKIFDEVKYAKCIVFTGGEVTLAYNEIKMICDVIEEKKVTIDEYQIVVNGTIYNKKLFDLLRSKFKKGSIAISCDRYHDKSIIEKYPDKLEKIMQNYENIMDEMDFVGLQGLPPILINSGKAKTLENVAKEEYSIIGFASMKKDKYLYVGPEISIDVDGNLTGGSNTYEITNDNHFGNIFEISLRELIIKNSVRKNFISEKHFIEFVNKLENNYFYELNSKGYKIKNKRLKKRTKRKVINANKIQTDSKINRLIYKYQMGKSLN